jgi:hypothetical protein
MQAFVSQKKCKMKRVCFVLCEGAMQNYAMSEAEARTGYTPKQVSSSVAMQENVVWRFFGPRSEHELFESEDPVTDTHVLNPPDQVHTQFRCKERSLEAFPHKKKKI